MLNYTTKYFEHNCEFCIHCIDNNNLRDMRCELHPLSQWDEMLVNVGGKEQWVKLSFPIKRRGPIDNRNDDWEEEANRVAAEGCEHYDEGEIRNLL